MTILQALYPFIKRIRPESNFNEEPSVEVYVELKFDVAILIDIKELKPFATGDSKSVFNPEVFEDSLNYHLKDFVFDYTIEEIALMDYYINLINSYLNKLKRIYEYMPYGYEKLDQIINNLDNEQLREISIELHELGKQIAPKTAEKTEILQNMFDCFNDEYMGYPGSHISTFIDIQIVKRFRDRKI